MNSALIQQVLADQRKMVANKSRGIPRKTDLSVHLRSSLITVITGVRRSGKSTLALQLADRYPEFHFISLDDERLLNFTVSDFHPMLIEMKRISDAKTIVLDEVQLVHGWERFARRLHDEGYKVIITGSNAKLLSSELATHLTGRYLKTEVFPFSFPEFLSFHGIDPDVHTSDNLARILNALDDYLRNGGFPEYLKLREPEVLKRIYDDIVYRDLIVRFSIRNVTGFKNMAQYLFSNVCGETGYLPLSKILGLNSATSVKEYLAQLTEGYLVFEIFKYDHSLKKQYASNRKVYVIDNGLRNAVSFTTSSDHGKLLENAVFLELRRRYHEVWYYRSKQGLETDFLVNPGRPKLIQACHDLRHPATRQRETESLAACMKELGVDRGLIITGNEEETIPIPAGNIEVVPVWRWFLEESRAV